MIGYIILPMAYIRLFARSIYENVLTPSIRIRLRIIYLVIFQTQDTSAKTISGRCRCHCILCKKMEKYGFHEDDIDLFRPYLSNRKQIDECHNEISHMCDIDIGVPQGSVL